MRIFSGSFKIIFAKDTIMSVKIYEIGLKIKIMMKDAHRMSYYKPVNYNCKKSPDR